MVPGFERVALMQVDQDGTMHLLHLLLSVPVDLYSTSRRLFNFRVDLSINGFLPFVELPVDVFRVQRSVLAVPRADHVSRLEGVTPYVWQARPCKRVTNSEEGGRNLACQGLTFMSLDSVARLLETSANIAEVSQILFLLLDGWATCFKKKLNWLQFSYTAYLTGD